MSTDEEICKAVGLKDEPGPRLAFILNKIVNDHEVLDLAARLAAQSFIVAAIKIMAAPQIERLLKRCQPEPKPHVQWAVLPNGATGTGKLCISMTFGPETVYWSGTASEAHRLRFHGEVIPADIAALYAMHAGNGGANLELDAARRDWLALEEKKRQQVAGPHRWVDRDNIVPHS